MTDVLDMFKTFLDEATENESFGFNMTESDKLLLKESVNNMPPLKVTFSCPSTTISQKQLPISVPGGRSAHVQHWLSWYHLQHCFCCLLHQTEITEDFSQVIIRPY